MATKKRWPVTCPHCGKKQIISGDNWTERCKSWLCRKEIKVVIRISA